ncbi:MAG: leucine-rich repeat domain-containing protein [Opitutaceae bacterium]|nr:leucine-rich repeat domain-containing protein [Cytophagales bacterium]
MKKLFFIFFIYLLSVRIAVCQTVVLPDSNFVQFLRDNYQTTLLNGNKLVIAEAAKIKGVFQAGNKNISNIYGIQFFTGLQAIDLSYNNLSALPDISNITNLDYLNLTYNQLSKLPDLQNLKKLTYLDFVENNITSIPDLSGQSQLRTLLAKGNLITTLPSLDSLTNLNSLDLSYNKLEAFPKIPVNNKIITLNLNDNKIKTLPDTFIFPNLEKIFLYHNFISFTELIKIKNYQNYNSYFIYVPQSIFKSGSVINQKEGEDIVLSTQLDMPLSGVAYNWYKNGKFLKTITGDTLQLKTVSYQDSGKYTCIIKYIDFPNLNLTTDTFRIKIVPCFDPKKLSTIITGISCRKQGSLLVQNTTGEKVNFILKSNNTTSVYNGNGNFYGLTEPSYTLKVITYSGCEKIYPFEIVVPKEDCKQILLTPDGDGENDAYFFKQQGKVIIYDKTGEQVKVLQIPSEWDGSVKGGKVAPGYYSADINNGESTINISVIY